MGREEKRLARSQQARVSVGVRPNSLPTRAAEPGLGNAPEQLLRVSLMVISGLPGNDSAAVSLRGRRHRSFAPWNLCHLAEALGPAPRKARTARARRGEHRASAGSTVPAPGAACRPLSPRPRLPGRGAQALLPPSGSTSSSWTSRSAGSRTPAGELARSSGHLERKASLPPAVALQPPLPALGLSIRIISGTLGGPPRTLSLLPFPGWTGPALLRATTGCGPPPPPIYPPQNSECPLAL